MIESCSCSHIPTSQHYFSVTGASKKHTRRIGLFNIHCSWTSVLCILLYLVCRVLPTTTSFYETIDKVFIGWKATAEALAVGLSGRGTCRRTSTRSIDRRELVF